MMKTARSPLRDSSGAVLLMTLFVLLFVGALGTAMWTAVARTALSANSHEEALRASELAEAGATHALSVIRAELSNESFTRLLRGDDNTKQTADDGLLVGFGLDSARIIPATGRSLGRGTYFVQFVDDPADADGDPLTDSNERAVLRATATTNRNAEATVDVFLRATTQQVDGVDVQTITVTGWVPRIGN